MDGADLKQVFIYFILISYELCLKQQFLHSLTHNTCSVQNSVRGARKSPLTDFSLRMGPSQPYSLSCRKPARLGRESEDLDIEGFY